MPKRGLVREGVSQTSRHNRIKIKQFNSRNEQKQLMVFGPGDGGQAIQLTSRVWVWVWVFGCSRGIRRLSKADHGRGGRTETKQTKTASGARRENLSII